MTTIPTEPKKRHKLTQEDCDTARLLMARQRTLKEIAEIIDVDPSTVGKIRLADYNLEKYLEQRKAMNRKTKENNRKTWVQQAEILKTEMEEQAQAIAAGMTKGVEQVAGQLQMDLQEAEEPKQDEQTKQMRFQAALMDKLLKKMDELIGVLRGGAEK